MGERGAYRVRGKNGKKTWISHLLRKQWYLGGSREEIEDLVRNIAKPLIGGWNIGDDSCALRDDLYVGRLTAALYKVTYYPPFDSIEPDINCDINNHGIFEIELIEWNKWRVNHYSVEYTDRDGQAVHGDRLGDVFKEKYYHQKEFFHRVVCDVAFDKGKSLDTGMHFDFGTWTSEYDDKKGEGNA